MIFAVGRQINVVTFKTKIMILIIKLLRMMRAGIYMLFPLVGWKKVLFHGKKAGKRVFLSKRGWNFIFVTAGHPVIHNSQTFWYIKNINTVDYLYLESQEREGVNDFVRIREREIRITLTLFELRMILFELRWLCSNYRDSKLIKFYILLYDIFINNFNIFSILLPFEPRNAGRQQYSSKTNNE